MKKVICFFLVICFAAPLLAQGNDDEGDPTRKRADAQTTLRPGMEIKRFGGITMVVPEGTEIYERDGQTFMEGPDEYAARRFRETEQRLRMLEERIEELELKVESLEP